MKCFESILSLRPFVWWEIASMRSRQIVLNCISSWLWLRNRKLLNLFLFCSRKTLSFGAEGRYAKHMLDISNLHWIFRAIAKSSRKFFHQNVYTGNNWQHCCSCVDGSQDDYFKQHFHLNCQQHEIPLQGIQKYASNPITRCVLCAKEAFWLFIFFVENCCFLLSPISALLLPHNFTTVCINLFGKL